MLKRKRLCNHIFVLLFVSTVAASKIYDCHDLLRLRQLSSGTGSIRIFLFVFHSPISVIISVVYFVLAFMSATDGLPLLRQSTSACRASRDVVSVRFDSPLNVDITTG
jgi:hypothetical protein